MKTGFYWVKADGWWQVAYYLEGSGWDLVGRLHSQPTVDQVGGAIIQPPLDWPEVLTKYAEANA